jgi:hypothetical protein
VIMPETTNVETIIDPHPASDQITKRILDNLENIRKLQSENNKLKTVLVENQESIKRGQEQKLKSLIGILNYKDAKYKEYQQKVKEDFAKVVANLARKLQQEREKNMQLQKIVPLIRSLKEENKQIREDFIRFKFMMKKEYVGKMKSLNDNYRLHSIKSKDLVKEYELHKLESKQAVEVAKQRNLQLIIKVQELTDSLNEQEKENKRLSSVISEQMSRLKYLDQNSLANDKKLDFKIREMRAELEAKLKNVTKTYLDKELEYRARIESLNQDMKRYHDELKFFKEKFYRREMELKQKLKELTL